MRHNLCDQHSAECARRSAKPRNGRAGFNEIPAALLRVVEKPEGLRLEFTGDIAVEAERREFENYSTVKDWVVEFPQSGLRIL